MDSNDIFNSLGKKVVMPNGEVGTLLGCVENDDHLAVRGEDGVVSVFHRRYVFLEK